MNKFRTYYDESEDESEEEPRGKLRAPFLSLLMAVLTRISVDWSHAGLAQSLPIPIGPLRAQKATGLPSMQPKSLQTDRPKSPPALDKGSSAALRRASYAERDRYRHIDPGALDFVLGNDDLNGDGDADSDLEGSEEERAASRGRLNALRILKARSELPSEGMWRSLAN